ncbi:MAG: hypothetical protein ABIH41_05500 [Nanoarchaeota archaeon]
MDKLPLFALVAFLFLMPLAHAQSFQYVIEPVNDSIGPTETAVYTIVVTNNAAFADRFQVAGTGSKFIVRTDPTLEGNSVPAGGSTHAKILVSPRPSVGYGPFGVPVKIKAFTSGDFVDADLSINIRDPSREPTPYPVSVALTAAIDKEVDPRQKVSVELTLRNRFALDVESLTIVVDGELFRKEFNTSLGSLEEKGTEMVFSLDDLEPPGGHTLTVRIYYDGKVVAESTKLFHVVEYSDLIQNQVPPDDELFKTTYVFDFRNEGNHVEHVVHKVPVPITRRIFSSSDPKAKVVSEFDKSYLVWEFDLQPTETAQVRIVENYRLLVVAIIIIVLAVLSYYMFRSPIIVEKDAFTAAPAGGVSEAKVKLFIRNRSRKTIRNLRVIDRVPSLAEVEKSKQIGTLHPNKIIKDVKKGTLVRWDIDSLDPFEERIIAYTIVSKLKIVGGLSLPAAKVKFDARRGVERQTYSNEVNLTRLKD